ncbi:right-handed parallel beta-helix repeat-containing protein [Geobacter sp. AOG2]|uniref:right-handed parallel beta-helix repeat-containing protein n=1 Tax=Geobacter sp. AOG2 TaxID=1566347 RepID=UPI001CC366D1|nr:right-handed parallel beta-helix repeat-containing protein [Geobacter sp. AOG2]GFE61109.1 lipoprotein [Geobacter sp. AOG2]
MKNLAFASIGFCLIILSLAGCQNTFVTREETPLNKSVMSARLHGIIPLEPARPPASHAFNTPATPSRESFDGLSDLRYEQATLTEDATWRGTVLIKGAVVVAPQATLRIEPGTTVRFARIEGSIKKARLVVLGRIQCIGTAERPIRFSSDAPTPVRGDWGGILLLSTEKRNQFEHTSVEGAETGIEAHFSAFTAKSVRVTLSKTGVVLRDSIVSAESSSFSACETGIEVHDGEFELRDSSVSTNRLGMSLSRSSVVLTSTSVTDNARYGILAEECRLRISSGSISSNGAGAVVTGGEGQIFMTRFMLNKDTALQLGSARMKVNRSLFADNDRDALRIEDGRATVWGCAFRGNGGFNLYNAGREVVTAVQNWWGGDDEKSVSSKVFGGSQEPRSGTVQVFPWLSSQPPILP